MKLLIIYVLLLNTYLFSELISPSWYPKHSNTHEIYAYGVDLKTAKTNIVNKIKNDLNIKNVSFSDVIVLNRQNFENKIFLKVKYVNESIETQITNKVKSYAFKQESLKNTIMQNTSFFKYIYNEFGYYPNIILKDNYLVYKNDKFLIKKHEIAKLYSSFTDANIKLDIKDTIQSNENFFIEVASSYEGYLTLARVYEGKFEILFKNQKIQDAIVFPNFKISDGMQLHIREGQRRSKLLSMAVVCSSKKDFSSYKMLLDINTKNNTLGFGDFLNDMKTCKMSSKTTEVIQ